MLEKFFKPKWQHNKPEVRKQALLALQEGAPETLDIYTRVAQQDSDAGVRRLAVNRVLDLAVLRAIGDGDGDGEVRELARKRFFRMVAGLEQGPWPLTARLEWVQREAQTELLEAFARQGREVEMRLAALARVNREALLGDLAIADADAQVRLAAAQRLSQPSTMARVAKESRRRDKKVYALIQGQLDKLKAEQEKPEHMAQEARGLCGQVETLCKAKDMLATVAQKDHAFSLWRQLQQSWNSAWGEFPAEIAQRWLKAVEQYERRYQEFLAEDGERRQREQQYEALRQRKRALCADIETQIEALTAAAADAPQVEAAQAMAHGHQQAWSAAEMLPREEELALHQRFRQALDRLRQLLRDLGQRQTLAADLTALHGDVQRLLTSGRFAQEKDIKELRRRLQVFADGSALLDKEQYEAVRQALDKLVARRQQQEEKAQQQMARYRELVAALEQDLAQGVSAAAVDHQRELRDIGRRLSPAGKRQLAEEGWQGRLHDATQQLEEIRDWKRWSGTPHKESLVREMEQLAAEVSAGAGNDIESLAAQVRAARAEWKRLGETDAGLADQLWERFNAACNTAYAPCEVYFKAQADERAINQQRRQVICDGLDGFIASLSDSGADDWQRIDQIIKTAQQEWRTVGAVARKEGQSLGKRYKTAMDSLRARLDQHLQRHGEEKAALVENLRQLLAQAQGDDAGMLAQALEQAKQMQQQWKRVGRAKKERTLWEEFRALNDQLFGRRQAVAEAQKQELQQVIDARVQIIDNVAALAARPPEEVAQAGAQYAQLRRDWEQAAHPGKEQMQALTARYRQACRDIEQAQQRAVLAGKRRWLDVLEDKSELCCRLERLLQRLAAGETVVDLPATVEATQQAWQALASGNDDLEEVIQRRFQQAVEAAVGAQARGGVTPATMDALGQLCVRLELLAEIDTPEAFKAQRMQYQLEHLAEKMRGEARPPQVEFRATLAAWYALPCAADAAAAEVLRQRFLRARDHCMRHAS